MSIKWIEGPDCGRKLAQTDGETIYLKCRGSFRSPKCRTMLAVDPKTGKVSHRAVDVDPHMEGGGVSGE